MPVRSTTLSVVLLRAAPCSPRPSTPARKAIPTGRSRSSSRSGRPAATISSAACSPTSCRSGSARASSWRTGPARGTVVGTQAVINSPPDGYTLLVGGLSNIVFNAGLYQKLSYDPLNDLSPSRWCSTFPTRWSPTRTSPTPRRRR